MRSFRRSDQPIEVRIELVKHAARERRGSKHSMTAMHHVIIERQYHECGIGDDAAEHARIHCIEVIGLRMHRLTETRERFFSREDGGCLCVGHRLWTITEENSSRTVAAV